MAQQQGGAAGPAPIMAAGKAVPAGEGLRAYYRSKIEELEVQIRDKQHNLKRMEAQRNELNTKGARASGGAPKSKAAQLSDCAVRALQRTVELNAMMTLRLSQERNSSCVFVWRPRGK